MEKSHAKGNKGNKELRKRVTGGEIVIIKSDKSGKIMAMNKGEYLNIGIKVVSDGRKIAREEVKKN